MTTGSAGTNGFLFCDLRGYAAFVDTHGDHAAAELLATYRSLVREVVAAHAGAEIRTEGDSVYVVFPTASAAVEAGLAIVAAAGEASTPERPVRVGVGSTRESRSPRGRARRGCDSPSLAAADRDSGVTTHVTPAGASRGAAGLATLGGDLRVAYSGGQVARVGAPSVMPAAATVAPTLTGIAADASGVYVATGDGGQVLEIDPSSLAVRRAIDVGGRASGVAVAPDGSVWVTVSALDG